VSELDPDSHRQVNTLQQLVAELALADLVLEGDERVLDVGCGDENVAPFSRSKATGFEIG
jgi:cyclopropane fatty-acyl-phospholipid synthase-like methyltransferase